MLVYPKEIIIATLRDYFSKDIYYRYVADQWGFPKTADHTDLPLGSGMQNNSTTRIFIGEAFRYDGIFYPAILVKSGGFRYVPISINRNTGTVSYEYRDYIDGYGNSFIYKVPANYVFAGAWEGSISIDVITRSLRSRDDIVELVGLCFADIAFEQLYRAGVIVKPPSISGPSESEDRNDKLFRQSITIDVRTEWRREIPVTNVVELINFSIEFGNINAEETNISPNLTINSSLSLLDHFSF